VILASLAGAMLILVLLAIAPSAGAIDLARVRPDKVVGEIQSGATNDEGYEYSLFLVPESHQRQLAVTCVRAFLEQGAPFEGDEIISVGELESKPDSAGEPPVPVYSYFNIVVGAENYTVLSATIEFRVEKELLEKNDIEENSVKLLRLNSEWQELPTDLIEVGETYLYYEAESPGFSLFAVSLGKEVSRGGASGSLLLYAAIGMAGFGVGFSLFYWFRLRRVKPFTPLEKIKQAVKGEKRERAERPVKPTGGAPEPPKPRYKSEAELRKERDAEAELIRRLKRAAEREEE